MTVIARRKVYERMRMDRLKVIVLSNMRKSRAKSVSNGKEDEDRMMKHGKVTKSVFQAPKHAVSSSVDPAGFGCYVYFCLYIIVMYRESLACRPIH